MTLIREQESGPRAAWSWLPHVVIVLVAVVALVLAWSRGRQANVAVERNRQLSIEIGEMRGRLALREQELLLRRRLQHQSRLKSSVVLSGMMSDSTRLDLRLAELRGPLLLYSLHPGCDACLANLAFLNKLHAWRACGATVLGVLAGEPERLEDVQTRYAIRYQVLVEASGTAWEVLPLAFPPHLILVGEDGQVGGWWGGVLSGKQQSEIEVAMKQACAVPTD